MSSVSDESRERRREEPPPPKPKMPESSRKNCRFSGKNNGNRVKLIWRMSVSVSAKSVFTLAMAVRLGVSR